MDVVFILLGAWIHARTGDTLYTCAGLIVVTIIGLVFLVVLPTTAKLTGLYLVYAYAAAYVMFIGSVAANTNGYTKKIMVNAVVLMGYTCGNIVGPLIMTSNQAPLYVGGVMGCIGANVVVVFLTIGIRIWMARMNKKKAANPVGRTDDNEDDMTDLVDPNYVYRL
jgi:hypothetical protein